MQAFRIAPAWLIIPMICLGVALRSQSGYADDQAGPTEEAIRSAVTRALPLLVAGAKGSLEKRKQCFTCHNQGLPIMALVTARSRGFDVDAEHLSGQLKFIAEFLERNKAQYAEGKGQGGQVDTAGYALWALDNGGFGPDETTAAVSQYLLQYQQDRDHWEPMSKRPPSEQSFFTSSYVALRGLKVFGTPDQRERIDKRIEAVRAWLVKTPAEDTEDRVFRLRALSVAGADAELVRAARDELARSQRPDGGWSQLGELPSDAYATGSALVALCQAGEMETTDASYSRALAYLVSTQAEDGSWHVVSRSKPFQAYFESGYPHGKDQFISIAAAGWATTALALALPPAEPAHGPTQPTSISSGKTSAR